jgi:hypothetical protein
MNVFSGVAFFYGTGVTFFHSVITSELILFNFIAAVMKFGCTGMEKKLPSSFSERFFIRFHLFSFVAVSVLHGRTNGRIHPPLGLDPTSSIKLTRRSYNLEVGCKWAVLHRQVCLFGTIQRFIYILHFQCKLDLEDSYRRKTHRFFAWLVIQAKT